MHYLAMADRSAITVVFLLAVTGKTLGAGAFTAFTRSVAELRAVPDRWVATAARATVLAEAAVVLTLIGPVRGSVTVGFGLAATMTGLVSIPVVRVVRSGKQPTCRCFGRSDRPIGAEHLVRNAVLLLLALTGLVSNQQPGSAIATGLIAAMLAGLVCGLAIATFDDLANLVSPGTPATGR